MRHFKKITYTTIVLFLMLSCTDLDESLNSGFTDNFTPSNPGFGQSTNTNIPTPSDGMGAAFTTLLNGTANHGGYYSVQGIPTDEMVITQKGGDWFDGGIWLNMHRHDFRSTNPGLNGAWGQNYGGILQVNDLLASGNMDANQTAQLRTLRAFYYWRLSDLFGRVKIITQPGVDSPQVDRPAVFNFIVDEIKASLPDLTPTAGYSRITTGVANALLARVYLNGEVYTRPYPYTPGTGTTYWQEAIDAADEVINSGLYELDPSFESLFGPANVQSPEHIFIVPFDEATGGGMNFAQMTLHYPSQLTWRLQEQPWNGYSTLEAFYNSYADGDERKEAFFIEGPQVDAQGNPILDVAFDQADTFGAQVNYTPFINELAPNGSRQAGARLGKFSNKMGQRADMDNDYTLLRYADVLLMKAEAVARRDNNWNNSTTLLLVNQVRARANAGSLSSLDENEFLAERGREMFQESIRRTDQIRFNRWGDAWWEKGAHSNDYFNVMPIPLPQINATTDGTLTQHPDYN